MARSACLRASASKRKMCSEFGVPMDMRDKTPSFDPMLLPSQSRMRYCDDKRIGIAFDMAIGDEQRTGLIKDMGGM